MTLRHVEAGELDALGSWLVERSRWPADPHHEDAVPLAHVGQPLSVASTSSKPTSRPSASITLDGKLLPILSDMKNSEIKSLKPQ